MRQHVSRRRRQAAIAALALLTACATNPATGRRQVMLVSEAQEIEMGRQADKEVGGSLGLYPDEGVQAYVAQLGKALVAGSERPNLPWTFRVVDDPTVNAFALPGGFIYVTRGLMTHMRSEAELASVIGHEIGHVTARHSAAQISKSQLASLGLVAGMIVRPELQRFGDLAQAGMQLMFLKFGRNDERQADDLGLRYIGKEGYDPREMVEVFSVLDKVSQASGDGGRLPAWLSTHPAPEDRAQRIGAAIAANNLQGTRVDQREYLRRIDGMVFGENPREGFFEGAAFFHPDLRWKMVFPTGWKTRNEKQLVGAVSPNEDAIVVLTLAPGADAERAAQEFLGQQGLRAGRAERTRINGLPAVTAVFEAQSEQAIIAGRVAFVEHDGKVYRLLGYTPSARWNAYSRAFDNTVGSFDELTERRYLDVQPRRLKVVDVTAPTSLEAFAERNRATVSRDVLALINGVAPTGMLPGGQPAKAVIGGRLPAELGVQGGRGNERR
jgi:predicted Zn-dependent protease